MSLPAIDTFSAALSGNWTIPIGDFVTGGGSVAGNTAGQNLMWWNADSFANDHSSLVTLTLGANLIGPAVRVSSTGGGTGYVLSLGGPTSCDLYVFLSGSPFFLHSFGTNTSTTSGTTFRLAAVAHVLHVYQDGVEVGSGYLDNGPTTGAAGVYAFGTANAADDWTGDNVGGAAARALFRTPALAGVGIGGSFFRDPLQAAPRAMARRTSGLWVPERMAA